MAMVPLPQFQAQRPQAISSQVNVVPPHYNSFWGTVAPNLLQLAGGVRNMIEGDPGVRMQERQQNSLDSERTTNQLRAGENQAANEAYLDAQIAKTDDPQRIAELQALRAHAGDFVPYKNREQEQRYKHMSSAQDSITRANDLEAQMRQQKPGSTAKPQEAGGQSADQLLEAGQQLRGGGQSLATQTPDNLTGDIVGAGKMAPTPPQTFPSQTGEAIRDLPPPQAPGEPQPASTGPGQPLPPNATGAGSSPQAAAPSAQERLYDIAAWLQTSPENLHINSEEQVIPSTDLVLEGKAQPRDAIPRPLQGSISPEQARYSESVGQQLVDLKRKAVQDTYLARAWGDLVLGKDVSDAGLAALDLNDARTQQAITGAQYNLGINSEHMSFNNIQKLAIWKNMTQDQIRNISLGDEGTKAQFKAEFGDMIRAYNSAPVNVRIAMDAASEKMAKDQYLMQKIQLEYQAGLAKAEAEKLKINKKAAYDDAMLGLRERQEQNRENRTEQAGRALDDLIRHRGVSEGQTDRKIDQSGEKIKNTKDHWTALEESKKDRLELDKKLAAAKIDRWTFQNKNDAARTKIFRDKQDALTDPKNPQAVRSAAAASMMEQKANNNYINSAVAANGVVTRGLKQRRPGDMEYPDMFVRDHYNTLLQMKRDESAKAGKIADIGQPQALHSTTQALLHTMYQAAVDKDLTHLRQLADPNYDWGKLAGKGVPPEELVTLHKAADYYHSRAKGLK